MNKRFAFMALNPAHAVGFEMLGRECHVVVTEESRLTAYLSERGARIVAVGEGNGDRLSSEEMMLSPLTAAHLSNEGIRDVLMFKHSMRAERAAQEAGCRMLSSPASLARRLENKVNLPGVAAKAGVLIPRTIVRAADTGTYEECSRELGLPFVAQAPKGFGGAKTYIVRDSTDMDELRLRYETRPVKFTDFIEGDYLTINGFVVGESVTLGGVSTQVTGLPECTPYPFGTCGNDLIFGDPERNTRLIGPAARAVGLVLGSEGFCGVFGLDFVLAGDTPYLVDINPRLTASLALHTALQREQGLTPLVELHIRAHLGETLGPLMDFQPFAKASSVVMYNTEPRSVLVGGAMDVGVYDIATLERLRDGVDTTDLMSEHEAVVLPVSQGTIVSSGSEVARIYLRRGCMSTQSAFVPEVARLVELVRATLNLADLSG